MSNQTFNEFCEHTLDRLYDSRLPQEAQSTGYKELRRMVEQGVEPHSLAEITRWEQSPTKEELRSIPDVRYLRHLHPLLRPIIVEHWNTIKNLKL
jgi:hypothetical protein